MDNAVPRLESFEKDFRKIYSFLEANLASKGVRSCEIDWITTNTDDDARVFTIKAKGLMYFVSVVYGRNRLYLHFGEGAKSFIYGGSFFNRCYEVEDLWEKLSGKKVNAPREPQTVYYGCSSGHGLQDSDKVAFYFENMEVALKNTLKPYGEVGEEVVKKVVSRNWEYLDGLVGLKLSDERGYMVRKTTLDYIRTMHTELRVV